MQSQPDPLPVVAAVVPVREHDLDHLDRALSEIRNQVGVRTVPVLVDQTLAGELEARELGDAVVLREPSPSRGLALARGGEAVEAEVVLVWEARASYPADRAARQLAALDADPLAQLCTGDLGLVTDRLGADDAPYTLTRALDLSHDALPGLWRATIALRRALLSTIDRAAFAPAEYGLLVAARASRAWVHTSARVAEVAQAHSDALDEAVRIDAELLRLQQLEPLEAPEITVLLATHNRCDVLLQCVEGFARQLVRPGTLEIVVVDDASRDATPGVMPHVSTGPRFVFDRNATPSGASGARNTGLPRARGRLVLFVNDDTIPGPHFVRQHLEAHRELGEGFMVQGLFRQPPAILANALNGVLDDSEMVFGYPAWSPGQELVGAQLYTCNVSVSLAAVRAIGGFDASYSTYGCEDTDLGERLAAAGQQLVYRPECEAVHLHALSVDDFMRRQFVVARAHIRLYADHPHLLDGQPFVAHTIESLEQNLATFTDVEQVERAVRSLAAIDTDRAGRASGAAADAVTELKETLRKSLRYLHVKSWTEGLVEGMRHFGYTGFEDLLAKARAKKTIASFEGANDDQLAAAAAGANGEAHFDA